MGAGLGGTFIVLYVTALAVCTTYKYERDMTLGDRLDGDKFKGGNVSSQLRQFVYFQSCFENVHTRRSRETV